MVGIDNVAGSRPYVGATGTCTWEWFFRHDAAIGYQRFIGRTDTTDPVYGGPLDLFVNTADGVVSVSTFRGTTGGVLTGFDTAAGVISEDTDHHCVVTFDYDAPEMIFYVDGVNVGTSTTTFTGPYLDDLSTTYFMGTNDIGSLNEVDGTGGGFAMYSQVLTPARVTAHYDALVYFA